MATDKTRKTPAPKAKAPKKEEAPIIDTEKEDLKKQLADLQAQIAIMAKAMANQPSADTVAPVKKNRQIRFVNLTNGTVVLKGSSFWEIDGRFSEKSFLESEARIIVSNMSNLIRSGMVYIADAQFVEDNDLSEIYLNILSDEDMKTLLQKDASYVIDMFKTVSDGQKNVIVDMIRDEKALGHEIDANILMKVGDLAGLDLLSED